MPELITYNFCFLNKSGSFAIQKAELNEKYFLKNPNKKMGKFCPI